MYSTPGRGLRLLCLLVTLLQTGGGGVARLQATFFLVFIACLVRREGGAYSKRLSGRSWLRGQPGVSCIGGVPHWTLSSSLKKREDSRSVIGEERGPNPITLSEIKRPFKIDRTRRRTSLDM
ncbi:hypothetical protein NDU88_000153 [Pleurodeles waltl]|uniref:Secreted protein n=1 Tax=Pleurodeles waltl TaxID=8319 RepID=A0AAV7UP68_PLEWA|nr:hypothetical protein NDU88_000153 [Pleurodeles waltl]